MGSTKRKTLEVVPVAAQSEGFDFMHDERLDRRLKRRKLALERFKDNSNGKSNSCKGIIALKIALIFFVLRRMAMTRCCYEDYRSIMMSSSKRNVRSTDNGNAVDLVNRFVRIVFGINGALDGGNADTSFFDDDTAPMPLPDGIASVGQLMLVKMVLGLEIMISLMMGISIMALLVNMKEMMVNNKDDGFVGDGADTNEDPDYKKKTKHSEGLSKEKEQWNHALLKNDSRIERMKRECYKERESGSFEKIEGCSSKSNEDFSG
ncbi:hypothetical protein NC653_012444 [Populus alba x Populus x berolinensis]|uniref:Uncharacterized protein n=1 Tax=Populus alba x Populus x berolinensis TaxID=444605 RepID=A0AAD6QSJ5_9ROSI|nr:hypothetical protein NC653_012444 [Populus alba x Populus x berolinensis]